MDLFGFLQGISPWWWVAGALVLGSIEVLTFSFFLIWPGLAALAVAIVLWIAPDLSGTMQVFMFALLSVVLTVAGRQWVVSVKPHSDNPLLNSRAAALIGRRATVIDGFADGALGNVEIDGVRWRGRVADGDDVPAAGAVLEVTGVDGMTLRLRPHRA